MKKLAYVFIYLLCITTIFAIGCGGGSTANTVSQNPTAGPTQNPSATEVPTTIPTPTNTTVPGDGGLTNLFFLHHSVGNDLVVRGNVRENINNYNTAHGTGYVFWDHGYNGDGLRNPSGEFTGTNYNIPGDNTDPEWLHYLFTSSNEDAANARNEIMNNHEVIAFKSCYPNSNIPDNATLEQYKTWYLEMRNFFDSHPEKLFVVMSTPPLHRLDENANATTGSNARAFANWMKSAEYLSGHPNVVCFDIFDYFAGDDNFLKYEYEGSHSDPDSHPNELADQDVGPIFAQFLIDSAGNY